MDQLTEDHRLFLQEEEEELTMRPTLPWRRFNAWMLCVNAHRFMDSTRVKPFPTKVCPTSLAPCLSPPGHKPLKTTFTTRLGPKSSLARILHALQSFVQCHDRVLEVFFPQFQSRFFSSQNVVFAFWVVKILSTAFGRIHFPEGSLLPYSFLRSARTIPSIRCLQFRCRLLGKKHANQRQPRAVSTCPLCDRQ